jgi:hypothetical protein
LGTVIVSSELAATGVKLNSVLLSQAVAIALVSGEAATKLPIPKTTDDFKKPRREMFFSTIASKSILFSFIILCIKVKKYKLYVASIT